MTENENNFAPEGSLLSGRGKSAREVGEGSGAREVGEGSGRSSHPFMPQIRVLLCITIFVVLRVCTRQLPLTESSTANCSKDLYHLHAL